MNVLQVVPELNAGGVEHTTLEIDAALRDAGHGSVVASLGGRMEGALRGELVRFDVGAKNVFKIGPNVRRLREVIAAHDIDIVHARSRMPAWPALSAARKSGVNFVTTYHGIYNAGSSLKRRYNRVMAMGDLVIANSNYTRDHILAEHRIPKARIAVIPRGVDMARFDPRRVRAIDAQAQREIWNVPDGATLILLPGRLTPWKGQDVGVKALADLPEGVHLVLLGDAQGREDYLRGLGELADDLGVAERVHIPGHSTDMPTAYSAADIVLSTSIEPEAFGRVAAEAQAMGRIVIATAHGGALETVAEGRTGLLVPPGQADVLADTVREAMAWTDYDSRAARHRIRAQFSMAALQAATLAVYERVLG